MSNGLKIVLSCMMVALVMVMTACSEDNPIETSTLETVEETIPNPKKENMVELKDYLFMPIESILKAVDNIYLESDSAQTIYSNGNVEVWSYHEAKGLISLIVIRSKDHYCLYGVTVGMNISEINDNFLDYARTITPDSEEGKEEYLSSNEYVYIMNDESKLTVFIDDNQLIESVYLEVPDPYFFETYENHGKTANTELQSSNLSDTCDMVLCAGYDGEDYYELVTNQIDEYPSTIYKFGVIKNNQWFIEPSEKILFLDDEGWWKGCDKKFNNSISESDFQFIGDGVFLYKGMIIYKPSTGAYFENLCNRDYSSLINPIEFVGFQSFSNGSSTKVKFSYFNMDTGKSRQLEGFFSESSFPNRLFDISDGLFFASYSSSFTTDGYGGFFNTNGEMIINIWDEYKVSDYGDYMFHDGKYTMTVYNDSGVEFELTFDTKGNIINKTKK